MNVELHTIRTYVLLVGGRQPVRVERTDDRWRADGHPETPDLLTALCLSAGRPVPAGRPVDGAWQVDDSDPDRPALTLWGEEEVVARLTNSRYDRREWTLQQPVGEPGDDEWVDLQVFVDLGAAVLAAEALPAA